MKKILVTIVISLFATSAFAAVVGSKHDMRTLDTTGTTTEVCVYCHTPHGADTTNANAPLWNRSLGGNATAVYAGTSLEASTVTQMTIGAIDGTDAPLCISCHDGTVTEVLQNEPNSGTTGTFVALGSNLTLDLDFSDDHPIAFNYSDAQGTDPELNGKAAVELALGALAVSYGAGDEMWCSSCHDVHDAGFDTFLRMNNTNSALCTTCHAK